MGVERWWILVLFLLLLAMILIRRQKAFFGFPSLDVIPKDWGGRTAAFFSGTAPLLLLLLLLVLSAGLRIPQREQMRYGYGADIVFILDESASMEESLKSGTGLPLETSERFSKFTKAKADIRNFMAKRKAGRDRYGLTVFGSTAVRVLPLSFNHDLFLRCLDAQECVLTSTVISHPLALGLDELTRSETRSRILLFVSDGGGPVEDDKYGFSGIIREQGIRFYWIAIGDSPLDEVPDFLGKIGPLGKRINAGDALQLESAFSEIHRLEPSLILYRSSSPAFSPGVLVYAAFTLMALIWIADSLSVHNRRS